MTAGEIEQMLRSLLTQEFRVEEESIAPEVSFKELGLDSLDVVSLVMSIEDRLGVPIPEEDLEGIERYGQALELLERKVASRA